VADQELANQLAEIGVILLMFGVGLHFSLKDLLSVKAIAIPGAVVQIAIATLLGAGLAWALGWPFSAGLVFGLSLSTASTVVLLRAMQERRLLETDRGRIAVGWLIVEDIAMVLTLVLLPVAANVMKGTADADWITLALPLAMTVGKVGAFVFVMLAIGRITIPWVLHYVAQTGSRELFRLSVLAIALGVAFGATALFDVSFALGAFFAGMILSESELSQRAANETLPLRDAFAVLFFVSVGMLVDPMILVRDLGPVLATLMIIVFGKSVAAYGIVRLFGHPRPTALTISASLAQIGEFAFILAGLGVSLSLLPERGRDFILAGAILSILLNPLLFVVLDWWTTSRERIPGEVPGPVESEAPNRKRLRRPRRAPVPVTTLTNHVVLVGHGRVGRFISPVVADAGIPLLVIEDNADDAAKLKERNIETIVGNAADPEIVKAMNLKAARCLLVAIPDAFEGGQVVQQARNINPGLIIIARSHSEEENQHLLKHGASQVIMGEHEIAKAMLSAIPRQVSVERELQVQET
jgi:CPA2 family monovalent cation:H+ antiporter-2